MVNRNNQEVTPAHKGCVLLMGGFHRDRTVAIFGI